MAYTWCGVWSGGVLQGRRRAALQRRGAGFMEHVDLTDLDCFGFRVGYDFE
jgi:hypothetical protein